MIGMAVGPTLFREAAIEVFQTLHPKPHTLYPEPETLSPGP